MLMSRKIFGEPFDLAEIFAQRRVCEALRVAGYAKEAAEMFLKTVNRLREETRTSQAVVDWLTGKATMPVP